MGVCVSGHLFSFFIRTCANYLHYNRFVNKKSFPVYSNSVNATPVAYIAGTSLIHNLINPNGRGGGGASLES